MTQREPVATEAERVGGGGVVSKETQKLLDSIFTSQSYGNFDRLRETLVLLGRLEIDVLHTERREMLEYCLLHAPIAGIRYGAVLALSYVNDPVSIPVVEQAIAKEEIVSLRADMQQLLEQLQKTLTRES